MGLETVGSRHFINNSLYILYLQYVYINIYINICVSQTHSILLRKRVNRHVYVYTYAIKVKYIVFSGRVINQTFRRLVSIPEHLYNNNVLIST